MGMFRRLLGHLPEWTWGAAASMRRFFGDVGEWTWGTGQFGRTKMHKSAAIHRRSLVRPKDRLSEAALPAPNIPKSSHS